jgi:hypothetical protein
MWLFFVVDVNTNRPLSPKFNTAQEAYDWWADHPDLLADDTAVLFEKEKGKR